MKGKHSRWLVHILAALQRERLRARVAGLVDWKPLIDPEPGCTAIVGVCSRLPHVLMANLRCLWQSRWPDLKRVIMVVDCAEASFPAGIAREAARAFPEIGPTFFYYSPSQSAMAESLKLPYVYSWLSWCIALQHTTTAHVLIHDYDALALGPALGERYSRFAASRAKVQGIAWYKTNGIEPEDRLATTFEAFMDAGWLRSRRPVALFNKLRTVRGRSIDFDTTLDMQYRLLSPEERDIAPMDLDQLAHPSQMIHQYTMFRGHPGAVLPCFSIPMIPFFYYLGDRTDAIEDATRTLRTGERGDLDLVGDGTGISLAALDVAQVDWLLKQIVEACLALAIPPDKSLHAYGRALYGIVGATAEEVWRGDFTVAQRRWIRAAETVPISA